MKPFAFSLEAVLTVRAREEEAAAQEWAKALQAQAGAEESLNQAKRTLEDYIQLVEHSREGTFQPADQQVYLGAITLQQANCKHLEELLRSAVQHTAKQHSQYLQARMKHEMLTRLKQKRFTDFQNKAFAAEQSMLQDLIIAQHNKRSDAL